MNVKFVLAILKKLKVVKLFKKFVVLTLISPPYLVKKACHCRYTDIHNQETSSLKQTNELPIFEREIEDRDRPTEKCFMERRRQLVGLCSADGRPEYCKHITLTE